MRVQTFLSALAAATVVAAHPTTLSPRQDANPFSGRQLYVNPRYSSQLEETRQAFLDSGDTENAGKVQFVMDRVGTFVWISNIDSLTHIDEAIEGARAAQEATGEEQIIGLVLYNIPDRDCSAGESAGELSFSAGGAERYRSEYVDVFAEKVKGASDMHFAIVMEPDAMGNMVTGGDVPLCAEVASPQQEAIGYAVSQLQADNLHLYMDAAHGAWLGWPENIETTAEIISTIVGHSNGGRIRGFSTNVSNYHRFSEPSPPDFTEGSPSYDESNYASNLAAALQAQGIGAKAVVDQGRTATEGSRDSWDGWCNLEAGFGQPYTADTGNSDVDAIVWIKPGGESDGECGMDGAPIAGAWFDEYAQMLARNAHSDIESIEVSSS